MDERVRKVMELVYELKGRGLNMANAMEVFYSDQRAAVLKLKDAYKRIDNPKSATWVMKNAVNDYNMEYNRIMDAQLKALDDYYVFQTDAMQKIDKYLSEIKEGANLMPVNLPQGSAFSGILGSAILGALPQISLGDIIDPYLKLDDKDKHQE
jgi:hypothetical protein